MRWSLLGWIIPAVLILDTPVAAQGVTDPVISSPSSSQALQGPVAIVGTTDIPNFASAELDFAYISDETNTRFPIQIMTEPIQNNLLATWDTTTISDGDYLLFLRVYLTDGTVKDVSTKVQIRNYSELPTPVPTITPTELAIQVPTAILIVPSITPTSAPLPTPTLLPENPAVTNENKVFSGFWQGGLLALFITLAIGLVIRIRRS